MSGIQAHLRFGDVLLTPTLIPATPTLPKLNSCSVSPNRAGVGVEASIPLSIPNQDVGIRPFLIWSAPAIPKINPPSVCSYSGRVGVKTPLALSIDDPSRRKTFACLRYVERPILISSAPAIPELNPRSVSPNGARVGVEASIR